MATDRITGNTQERGETARLKSDIERLRTQVNAYFHHLDLSRLSTHCPDHTEPMHLPTAITGTLVVPTQAVESMSY